MRVVVAGLVGAVVGGALVGGWMWSDNRALENRVQQAEAAVVPGGTAEPAGEGSGAEGEPRRQRSGDPTRLFGAIDRVMRSGGDEANAAPAGKPDDPVARRERRQNRLRETFGRRDGETDEAYRERVAPLVGTMLMVPRGRMAERRREFEEAAGIDDEQRAKLDALVKDTQTELITVANQAIASGQLTPYRRNTAGLAGFVGGAATIAESADQRFRQLLTPDQIAAMEQSGFDVIEYLAFTSPWESVNPPPPEKP
jgi:hypothetical protein